MNDCLLCKGKSGSKIVCETCFREAVRDKKLRKKCDIEWHRRIVERDDWRCYKCGVSYRYQANNPDPSQRVLLVCGDHILEKSSHRWLRWDLDNGRTVCDAVGKFCHTSRHAKSENAREKCGVLGCPLSPLSSGFCVRHTLSQPQRPSQT